MNSTKPALETARAELDLLEAKSEAAFKAWRMAYYRAGYNGPMEYSLAWADIDRVYFLIP